MCIFLDGQRLWRDLDRPSGGIRMEPTFSRRGAGEARAGHRGRVCLPSGGIKAESSRVGEANSIDVNRRVLAGSFIGWCWWQAVICLCPRDDGLVSCPDGEQPGLEDYSMIGIIDVTYNKTWAKLQEKKTNTHGEKINVNRLSNR